MNAAEPVLLATDLRVEYGAGEGRVIAVDGVSFEIARGECFGVVGRSGSGKTQTFLAAIGLLPPQARVQGSVLLNGAEILNLPQRELSAIRGARLAMIFQDPMTSLTPHMKVGEQLAEVLVHHERLSRREAFEQAVEELRRVQIPDAPRRARQYPHELSGGMRQRVMIAMALLCRPDLLIADEPTTALDVTVQAGVLDLLEEIREQSGAAIAFVTHDLGVVAQVCDRAMVMLNGRVVECAEVDTLFHAPRHEYTRSLLQATPRLDDALRRSDANANAS